MASGIGSRILGGWRNYFWIAAIAVSAVDQLTKLASARIGHEPIVLVPGFLDLVRPTLNPHGAFSLGPGRALFYTLATLAGLALVGWFFVTSPAGRLRPHFALGCVCGGALGNLVDRVTLGAVRDFIDLHWMGRAHWPTFNVADAAICLGVGLLLLEALGPPGERGRQRGAARAS